MTRLVRGFALVRPRLSRAPRSREFSEPPPRRRKSLADGAANTGQSLPHELEPRAGPADAQCCSPARGLWPVAWVLALMRVSEDHGVQCEESLSVTLDAWPEMPRASGQRKRAAVSQQRRVRGPQSSA